MTPLFKLTLPVLLDTPACGVPDRVHANSSADCHAGAVA